MLRGTFKDQFGEFPAGTYVRNPIGSKHAPWVDADGCTIMVKLLQMAETAGEGTQPLHINLDTTKRQKVAFGSIAELYRNEHTGELVQMCWLDAGATFAADTKSTGGEELFVLSGSLMIPGESTLVEWGWARFPCVQEGASQRTTLTAGPNGAQVYRKTGHLTPQALRMEKIRINDDETIAGE